MRMLIRPLSALTLSLALFGAGSAAATDTPLPRHLDPALDADQLPAPGIAAFFAGVQTCLQ